MTEDELKKWAHLEDSGRGLYFTNGEEADYRIRPVVLEDVLQLVAEIRRLQKDLKEYGEHPRNCRQIYDPRKSCSCGLSDALGEKRVCK